MEHPPTAVYDNKLWGTAAGRWGLGGWIAWIKEQLMDATLPPALHDRRAHREMRTNAFSSLRQHGLAAALQAWLSQRVTHSLAGGRPTAQDPSYWLLKEGGQGWLWITGFHHNWRFAFTGSASQTHSGSGWSGAKAAALELLMQYFCQRLCKWSAFWPLHFECSVNWLWMDPNARQQWCTLGHIRRKCMTSRRHNKDSLWSDTFIPTRIVRIGYFRSKAKAHGWYCLIIKPRSGLHTVRVKKRSLAPAELLEIDNKVSFESPEAGLFSSNDRLIT